MINTTFENKNININFKGGITQKLKRNYYNAEPDIINIFNRHPQKNGIAGVLPKPWIEKLNSINNKNTKREIIKELYQGFAQAVQTAKENTSQATEKLNTLLYKHKILNKNQKYNIKKIDTSKAAYTENGYILEGTGIDSLFIKEFTDLKNKKTQIYKKITERHGKFVELARALQINNQIKDRHLMHTCWGDTKNGYMVSEYVKPLKEYKSPLEIKEFYDDEKLLIDDLYKKYGFTHKEIKKYNVRIGYEYEGKFYSYPEDRIIFNYFDSMFGRYGLAHYDLYWNPDNCIITSDKSGNPLIKLIDYGGISKV